MDASSWNGWNFYKGNNPYAYKLYPRTNLDMLDYDAGAHYLKPFVPVHNEWEASHAQLALGQEFAKTHPLDTLKMDAKKIFVACCDLKEAPEAHRGHTRPGVVLSNLLNHALLAGVLLLALAHIVRKRHDKAELLFVILLAAYLIPYIAGFLYMRHMVPLYGLAGFTAAIQFSNWEKRRLFNRSLQSPSGADPVMPALSQASS